MKLIIAGSRNFNNLYTIFITNLINHCNINISEIVCGCGGTDEDEVGELQSANQFVSDQGIDLLGEKWAVGHGYGPKYIPAKCRKIGRAAGPIRNKEMAEYGDALLLIWDGESRGSKSMKELMLKSGKPIYEVILKKYNV